MFSVGEKVVGWYVAVMLGVVGVRGVDGEEECRDRDEVGGDMEEGEVDCEVG